MPLPPSFPELSALDLFASVVALGSLSRAAAAHGITQPSASARIQHLERQVGVQLLDRSPTGSTPTDAGQLVAGWAEGVLRAADELRAGMDSLHARSEGRLRLSASFTIAEYLLPAWLDRFHRAHLDNPVQLHVANSSEVVTAVRDRRADLGFIESPDPVDDLAQEEVGTDELVVVVAPDHPWARRRSVDADRLTSTSLVLREPGSGTRDFLDTALREAGHPPPIVALELGSTAAIKNAVASSSLPGVLSRVAVTGDHVAGRLQIIEVSDLDLRRRLRLVWRSDRSMAPAAADLRELLRGGSGATTGAGP